MNSLRRKYLDQCLDQNTPFMKGRVLDVGGKKAGRRGTFIPPIKDVKSWEYLNIDETTKPDYCCSADSIPLRNGSIDTIIMMEVLEYLPNPKLVLEEIHRVLTDEGHAFISVPFLNPIHGDHWVDRARYTPVMLREIIEPVGLKIKSIEPMGSVGAVLFDTLRVSLGYASEKGEKPILTRALGLFRSIFMQIDKICYGQSKYINTGYFIILKKNL